MKSGNSWILFLLVSAPMILGQTEDVSDSANKLLVPGLFMQMEGIAGESKAMGRERWIDLSEVSSGLFQLTQTGGYGRSRQPAVHEGVGIIKRIDKSSPKLAEALAQGKVFDEVLIEQIVRVSEDLWTRFEFRLSNVLLTEYQLFDRGDGPYLSESVGLNYEKVNWLYQLCSSAGESQGRAEAFWDIETDTGGSSSNDPPRLDPVGNQSVGSASSKTIDLTIADDESGEENLEIKITTDRPDLIGEFEITGTGANRKLSFETSALLSGVASLAVTVSDGKDSRTTAIPVLIDVEMTPYEGYLAAYFDTDERKDLKLTSPIQDPDKDNIPTVIEYLLGLNPQEFNNPSEAVETVFKETLEGRVLNVDFRKRLDDANVQGQLWGSFDMKTWERLDASNPIYEENTQPSENPLFEDVSATITLPSGADPYFFRFQVQDVF